MAFNINRLVQPECGAPNPLVAAAQQIATRPSNSSIMRPTLLAHQQQQQQRTRQARLDFSQEFNKTGPVGAAQRQLQLASNKNKFVTIPTSSSHLSHSNLSLTQDYQHHQLARGQASEQMATALPMRLLQMGRLNNQSAQATITAGDQLEAKYRDDLLSQTSSNLAAAAKHDEDVAFWQSLSQKYIGPSTYDNISRLRESRTRLAEAAKTETAAEQLDELNIKDETQNYELLGRELPPRLDDMEYVFDERNPLQNMYEDPFSEGLKRLNQGDIPSAALLFEAAVQKDPENALAWRYLGTTQAQNEKDQSAIRALRNCLRLDSTDQEARLAISVSLVNETQHHEACKYLLEWLINHERYKGLGASLEDFHRLDNELVNDPFYINSLAEQHYSYVRDKFVAAARMSPNNPDHEVQNSLGVLFNMRGEYNKAVDCFKAALSVRSDDCLLWNRLGATLANGNKSDEAVVAYRRALEISPGFLRSRYNLAISLIHLNSYDEAAKQLVQILNMQAAGKGSKNVQIRTRSITSTSIWNTLRTVATLLNKPELYPLIDGRDLSKCNELIMNNRGSNAADESSGN